MFVKYFRRSGAPSVIRKENIIFGKPKIQALVFPGCPCPSLGSLCPRFCLRFDIINVEGQVTLPKRMQIQSHLSHDAQWTPPDVPENSPQSAFVSVLCHEAGLCEVACWQPSLFHTHRSLLRIHGYCRDPPFGHLCLMLTGLEKIHCQPSLLYTHRAGAIFLLYSLSYLFCLCG